MTRILLMTQLISSVVLVSPARASDARAAREPLRVTIVAEPWAAPVAPAELASSLRIRLPGADVSVVDAAAPRDGSERAVTVRWLAEPPRLRVERGSGDAVEYPLSDEARAGADRVQAARRAALFIALFADQAAPLTEAPSAGVETPSGESAGSGRIPPVVTGEAAPPAAAVPGSAPTAPASLRHVTPASWALSAQMGPALAISDNGIASTVALTLRGRRYLAPGTAVEIGAKFSGEYTAEIESQSVGVADRAFFAGVAYEAWLAPRVAVDLGAAFQYTYPVVDIDGTGAVSHLDTPTSMRLAVRTSAALVWSPGEHLTLGISATTAFSFREREYVDDTGREVLGLGTMTLDLTAGAGVRW